MLVFTSKFDIKSAFVHDFFIFAKIIGCVAYKPNSDSYFSTNSNLFIFRGAELPVGVTTCSIGIAHRYFYI